MPLRAGTQTDTRAHINGYVNMQTYAIRYMPESKMHVTNIDKRVHASVHTYAGRNLKQHSMQLYTNTQTQNMRVCMHVRMYVCQCI